MMLITLGSAPVQISAVSDDRGQWGKDLALKPLGQSGLGRAIAYMQGLWPGLVRFLENPRIPLDNFGTERAIRGPVVGRKNFYGSRSRRGSEVAATFHTIFETAKALRLDPPSTFAR